MRRAERGQLGVRRTVDAPGRGHGERRVGAQLLGALSVSESLTIHGLSEGQRVCFPLVALVTQR